MNTEILIAEASTVLSEWQKKHNTACILYIEQGKVRCRHASNDDKRKVSDLFVDQWYQVHGFNSTQWNTISTELFNQYNKEKLCQTRQKP